MTLSASWLPRMRDERNAGVGQARDLTGQKMPGAPVLPVAIVKIARGDNEIHALRDRVIDQIVAAPARVAPRILSTGASGSASSPRNGLSKCRSAQCRNRNVAMKSPCHRAAPQRKAGGAEHQGHADCIAPVQMLAEQPGAERPRR